MFVTQLVQDHRVCYYAGNLEMESALMLSMFYLGTPLTSQVLMDTSDGVAEIGDGSRGGVGGGWSRGSATAAGSRRPRPLGSWPG